MGPLRALFYFPNPDRDQDQDQDQDQDFTDDGGDFGGDDTDYA